jgi:Predicted pyridoxal phosphate-dependent enzyme apparently involved in regulation of cell wall biogenesis
MISVFGSFIGKEEIEAVTSCMESNWLGFGKNVDLFEKKFSERLRLSSFAMVDSGSNALFMAVKLLDLPPNSEVILPSFTWVSCAQSILMAGHKPVFCDVDINTMNIRAVDIREKITKKTAAIMVVHYAGLPVDMDSIIELGYPVIEDAAHAVDSTYKGKSCGSIGDIGIYSFDAVKNLTVGEGGGITFKNPELLERAKMLRYCGIGKSGFDSAMDSKAKWWEYNIQEPFIKMLPTNMAASIGIVQLDRLDDLQTRRKNIWDKYQFEFGHLTSVICPIEALPSDTHTYFTYGIRVAKRDDLARYLLDKGIYTTLRYHPLHLNEIYNQTHVNLPNTELLNKEALNIPLHPRMTDEEVEKVVFEIKSFLGELK